MHIYIYIYIYNYYLFICPSTTSPAVHLSVDSVTHNPPTNITPTKIAWVKLSGKIPLGLGIPPLKFKIMLESNPLKSIMLVYEDWPYGQFP